MARRKASPLDPLLDSPRVREAARALIDAVAEETQQRALTPKQYQRALRQLERRRGRPLPLPALLSGAAGGARVRLADGSTKLDFAGGIGVYGFGHGDADLLETAAVAAACDTVFQGHLNPGPEYLRVTNALLRHAGEHLQHVWLSLSGAMANENALKLILQKHHPADRIIAFERNFAGRTLSLSEISDKPAYREGLPLRGGVHYVPFYDPEACDPISHSVEVLDAHLHRHSGRIAAMCFELVQGEGGFHTAPPEFFRGLMQRCREEGVAVWVDEVQTFGRTGELFAFRKLGLEDLVDVVTAGKLLQGSAVLFSKAYNPKAGLMAGTYAGSTVGMAVGARIIERLETEGYLGPEGRIACLAGRFERRYEALRKRAPRALGPRSGLGAMQAFVPFDGSPELAQAVVHAAFEEGLMLWLCGSQPTKLRMLPPLDTTDEEIETAFNILEKALLRVAGERDLPC
ncbi:MAG: aminotransferase class III-fold pyridoxal phosphate-dependent enzyme [Deltaproteobacteria bacterium]|nr:aminotransferase class III-fold pyridoxal phosphate-dependent enzyme [Deltaproteobacteria bacterium]MBW2362771.1 aminotransferase class III-fold pyridoxal phosphate-dependent enzyme [Deltaproteobacteria bacterium]